MGAARDQRKAAACSGQLLMATYGDETQPSTNLRGLDRRDVGGGSAVILAEALAALPNG